MLYRKTDRDNEHNSCFPHAFINKLFKPDHRSVRQLLHSSQMTNCLIIRNWRIRRIRVFVQTFAYLYAQTSRLHNYQELIKAASFETQSWEGTAAEDRYYFFGILVRRDHATRVIRIRENIFISVSRHHYRPISILSGLVNGGAIVRSGKTFSIHIGHGKRF